ncbi:RNA polymerase sigma factor SigJ [Paractinoplanes maris]|uniref:RNA polymerase sigma factor SigJ n=1 Tax=Paractinoplanes maris TaxID=1734446 RepID=UPI0020216DC9|nr:RNA polymerase sigma factor SigJ [Actinoplanes maris]
MSSESTKDESAASREEELAQRYERARPRLIQVAYSVLGRRGEAEDVVSEAWLRLVAADRREPVVDVEAWAGVVVARAAFDVLRSARMRREVYVGPWLPEPIVEQLPGTVNPADRVTLDDAVSFGLLVMLESLTPAERTAFVLHDLFGMPFQKVAEAVGRSPDAVRRLASRARAHMQAGRPRIKVDASQHERTVTAFLKAAASGDLNGLLALLDESVVMTTDGGGKVTAARHPVVGRHKVTRFVLGLADGVTGKQSVRPLNVNGALGVGLYEGDVLDSVVSFTTVGERVARIDIVRAPEKLPT